MLMPSLNAVLSPTNLLFFFSYVHMSMMCCVLVYELHFCMCVVVHAHIIGIWEPFLVGSVAVIKLYVPSNLREGFIWLRHHDNSLSLREAMTGTLP